VAILYPAPDQANHLFLNRLRRGNAHAIAARGFGSVESHVGMVQEFLNITAREIAGKSEAPADADGELRRSQMDGPGKNGLPEIFGASHGAGRVTLIQHHQEFLTAIAAYHVAGADGGAQPAGNFAKTIVAGGVAEGVVDGLEMVDVAHHDGGTVSFAAGPANLAQE
jgi:hypothetical protein